MPFLKDYGLELLPDPPGSPLMFWFSETLHCAKKWAQKNKDDSISSTQLTHQDANSKKLGVVHAPVMNLVGNTTVRFRSIQRRLLMFSWSEVMLQAMSSVVVLGTTVTSGKYTPCVQLCDAEARASSSCLETRPTSCSSRKWPYSAHSGT